MLGVLKAHIMGFEEKCRNPLKPECEGRDIAVYIQAGSERLPICRECWMALAEEDVEWDERGMRFRGKSLSSHRKRLRRAKPII